ncbi:ATP-binding protein [Clostridium polynesiense]|uniref:ATP-binding protein n=1 Tax=Clostridium polynesiense TaxID=1325933 RepID=UPI00058CD6DE|nr:4Fe-4S binding protein [Clostridium polynesiense]
MIRKIVNIDKELCNGCGICINACHEAAIVLRNGKAELLKDIYCDGLGDCLSGCPTSSITIIEREADEYDDAAVKERVEGLNNKKKYNKTLNLGCMGGPSQSISREYKDTGNKSFEHNTSQLMQWPVQLRLVNSEAPFFKNADLLIAADCTAYAYGNFHNDFIKNKITLIACPKLDNNEHNKEKITDILLGNEIKSITLVRMEVPCCRGLSKAVKEALEESGDLLDFKEAVISSQGEIID